MCACRLRPPRTAFQFQAWQPLKTLTDGKAPMEPQWYPLKISEQEIDLGFRKVKIELRVSSDAPSEVHEVVACVLSPSDVLFKILGDKYSPERWARLET